MQQILITFSVFAACALVMSVGVMFGRKPLKGSCGGAGGNCPCAESGTPGACKLPSDPDAGLQSQLLGERYRIVAMVEEGGMGQVYFADELVHELVAGAPGSRSLGGFPASCGGPDVVSPT